MSDRKARHQYDVGDYWNAVEEAVDTIEAMQAALTALRSRLEAVESLAAKWEAQMVPASVYAAQLRALLAPAKSSANCGEAGCDREYDAGHNPCAKWRPAPEPPKPISDGVTVAGKCTKHRIETRNSPCSMGVQFRVVSTEGRVGPWREGRNAATLAWKAYKVMRKAQNVKMPEPPEPPNCEACVSVAGVCANTPCQIGGGMCASPQRRYDHSKIERSDEGRCGPTGRLFEKKEEVTP
jgi:hypothetical protein